MSDLTELYAEMIKDHKSSPRNCRPGDDDTPFAKGNNPLCGDKLTVWVRTKDGVIDDVSFQGEGCAISTASASMMTEVLKGKTPEEGDAIFRTFRALVMGEPLPADKVPLGKLAVFEGVRTFPMRVKCATLAWHTANAALELDDQTPNAQVSTE